MKKVTLIVGSVAVIAAIAALVYRFLGRPSGIEGDEDYFDEDGEDDAKNDEAKEGYEQMGIDAYLNEDPES